MSQVRRSIARVALENAAVPPEYTWWDVADPVVPGGGRWLGFVGSVGDVARFFTQLGRFAGEALNAADPASWDVGVHAHEAATALAAALRTPPFTQPREATLWYFPGVEVVVDDPETSPDAPHVDVDVELPARQTSTLEDDSNVGTTTTSSSSESVASTSTRVEVDELLELLEPVDAQGARDEERALGDPDAEYDRRGDR